MTQIHPQFIKDSKGNNKMVVLPIKEFNKIMDELEDIEDVKAYDEAMANDTGERILFSDYLKKRKDLNV